MFAHPANPWLINTNLGLPNGDGAKMSPQNRSAPFVEPQHYIIDPANLCCTLYNGIEDRLHVGRRATDDAEHLGRCCLMLQCLAQFCVALLNLFEQADVFDRDDGLIGKGFQESDVPVGEGAKFRAADRNHPDRSFLPEQGCSKNSASTTGLLHESRFRKLSLNLSHYVVNVNHLLINNGPAGWRAANGCWCRAISEWYRPIFRYPFICLSIPAINNRICGVTQSRRILCDHV